MPLIIWQKLLDLLTLKGYDIHGVQDVKDAKDDNERFTVCYNINKPYLLEWMNECLKETNGQKSASESDSLRAKGNSFYKNGNDNKSLELYNESVIVAPFGSEEMAIALANRSAVLSRLRHLEDALNDIELALESGYPEDKKYKLCLRKANLLIDSKKYSEAIVLLEEMKDVYIHNSDIKIGQEIFTTRLKAVSIADKEPNAASQASNNDVPTLAKGESNNLKSASEKLDLKKSTEKGRYVVANTNVKMGEVLFLEKPFALIVLPDQVNKHCHHCCKCFIAPIPCTDCNEALYCTNKCRLDSWFSYHKWECGGLSLCYKIGIAHLGLRVALLSRTTKDSKRYQQVYNLLPHTENMTSEDLYQYTLTAALLTLYLEYKCYFSMPCNIAEVEAMGGCILRHIAQMICNGHAITKIDYYDDQIIKSDRVISKSQQRIATAIYPSASMMNHSCNNNISNSFINDILVVRASTDIKEGEEVFNCYGPHYLQMEVEERQEILKSQYFFTCNCDKCTNPEENSLKFYSALKCTNCEGPIFKDFVSCASCGKQQPVVELMNMSLEACSMAAQGRDFSTKGNIPEAIKCFEKSLKLGEKCLFKDNFILLHFKDELAKNYAVLGDYNKCAANLEQCLPIIEARYGSTSIQLTQEYLKMMDIRFLQLGNLSNNPTGTEYRKVLEKTRQLLKCLEDMIEVNAIVLKPEQTKEFEELKLKVDFHCDLLV